ncbi:MAG: hypothetical protein HFH72_07010 [Lachnospiraceae bacterium]|nr:hypothetical protein [Lachnospiraceae bacterium]
MGKIDTVTKDYMKKNSVFADAFNYFIYGGKQVIKPENLQELDITEIAFPFGNGDEVAVQKFRDLLKAATLMLDGNAAYLILGVENESDVRYAEPVKTGLYDFLQYSKQVQQTAGRHREAKDRRGHNDGEFLTGFYREDKLTPVITLVILFGSKRWDGPRTLQEMMSTQNPDILKCVADYKINLIEPAAMGADDLEKFHSSLRAVLGFIKYSNDGDELDAFLSNERELESLDVEAARVIKACTNTDIEIDEKAEVINVCKAVREMNEKAAEEAAEKARLETLRDAIKNAMDSFHVSIEDAMKALKVGKEDQAILMKMI